MEYKGRKYSSLDDVYKAIQLENERLSMRTIYLEKVNCELCKEIKELKEGNRNLKEEVKNLKERIDILYEFIERNDKLVDEVIKEEDLDKLNRYIYIDDDLVDRTLESED